MYILQCTAELIPHRRAPGPLHGLGVVGFAPCTTVIFLEELRVLSQKVASSQGENKRERERECLCPLRFSYGATVHQIQPHTGRSDTFLCKAAVHV